MAFSNVEALEVTSYTDPDNSIRGRFSRFRSRHMRLFGSRKESPPVPVPVDQVQVVESSEPVAPYIVSALEQTWDDWLDDYAAGFGINTSDLPRPNCSKNLGFVAAPAAKHLRSYSGLTVNHDLINKAVYEHREWLLTNIQPLLTMHQIGMCTFSSLDDISQNIHFEVGLRTRTREIAREVSIDGHAILSEGYFWLADAKNDWRTKLNPLVRNQPYYRFYYGVPVTIGGVCSGVLSLFDAYPRVQMPANLTDHLLAIASQLGERIDKELEDMAADSGNETPNSQTPAPDSGNWSIGAQSLTHEKSRNENPGTNTSTDQVSLSLATIRQKFEYAPAVSRQISARETTVLPSMLFGSLTRTCSMNQAMRKACRIVSRILGVATVYIVEVRDGEHGIRLVAQRSMDGPRVQNAPQVLEQACEPSRVHLQTINSKFGINVHVTSGAMTDGILVPFRRQWRTQSTKRGKLMGGGFVLGAFSSSERRFSIGDVSFLQKMAKVLAEVIAKHTEINCHHTDSLVYSRN